MDFDEVKQLLKEAVDEAETRDDMLRIWVEKIYQKGKDKGRNNKVLGARYSEPIMYEVVDKLIEFLKDHKTSDLMVLIAAAIATAKESEEGR